MNKNEVKICGKVVAGLSYFHEINGERFYLLYIESERLSGYKDVIPVILSENLIDTDMDYEGNAILVLGEYRSKNIEKEEKKHLILYLFAKNIEFINESYDLNEILLEGYVCKQPTYRLTPRGRKLTDVLIAVNRSYGKTSYIPCICWGDNALFAERIEVGTKVEVEGRIQSREYIKVLSNGEQKKLAYEVSVSRLEVNYEN